MVLVVTHLQGGHLPARAPNGAPALVPVMFGTRDVLLRRSKPLNIGTGLQLQHILASLVCPHAIIVCRLVLWTMEWLHAVPVQR